MLNIMKGKKLIACMAAAVLMLAATGCAGAQKADTDQSLQKVLDAGQLVLGLDDNYPPMGFRDESGEIVGFDIDMAREVCNRLGITLVTQPIEWDEKENDLNSGKIDCIWNGMSASPERAKTMCLSDSYLRSALVFVTMSDKKIDDVHALTGKRVGVQAGSTTADELKNSQLISGLTLIEFGDNGEVMQNLEQGNIDVAFIDTISNYYYSSKSDERFYVLPDSVCREELAIGFRKDDLALRNKIQETIREMKADGTLQKISEKWFGSDITIVK